MRNIPEKCCANCEHLLEYPRDNAYGDADYLCIKLGKYVSGRYADITKAAFFLGDGKTPDNKAVTKCVFTKKDENGISK